MLQNNPQCTEFSAPGKVFILGEYAILSHFSAVVAAVGPRFGLRVFQGKENGLRSLPALLHPESPAGRLIDWAKSTARSDVSALQLQFLDPHHGQGGLGASTAQFALLYLALAQHNHWPVEWSSVWTLYRDLTAISRIQDGISPSGADLVAQWNGGVNLFGYRDSGVYSEDLTSSFDWKNLLVFSTTSQEGRKVPTHHHLARMTDPDYLSRVGQRLNQPLCVGIAAIRSNDASRLGFVLRQYAQVLREVGLEVEATAEDCRAFQSLPSVLGAKGTGAMQADGLVVLLKKEAVPGSALRESVLQMAKDRNLALVSEGIPHEPGVQCLGVV